MLILFLQTVCDALQHHVTCCLKTFMELMCHQLQHLSVLYSDYGENNPSNQEKRQICLLSLQAVFLIPVQRCCINSRFIPVNNLKCNNYAPGNAHTNFNHFRYRSSISICLDISAVRKHPERGLSLQTNHSVVCVLFQSQHILIYCCL